MLDRINKQPCTVGCDAAGVCSFDIKDFFAKLVAPCSVSQCVVQGRYYTQGAPPLCSLHQLKPAVLFSSAQLVFLWRRLAQLPLLAVYCRWNWFVTAFASRPDQCQTPRPAPRSNVHSPSAKATRQRPRRPTPPLQAPLSSTPPSPTML